MKQLLEMGKDAYTKPSDLSAEALAKAEPLSQIIKLLESQVSDGADYIAVNLDAFGESDPKITVALMVEYVRLVRKWGQGVPICIDSSNNDVLIAGLKEWYEGDSRVKPPLLNSVKVYTMDKILPLKKQYDFCFVGLLVGESPAASCEARAGGGSASVEELYLLARQIFDEATGKYGFKPEQLFFDSTVFPLAIDMPMQPGVPGYTYRAFETIKKIKSDPKMREVHCSLGVSNCARDLPGRKVGLCRAYVAKAMEYGLDAAIVNVAHHYGLVAPAAELLELVDAYAKMDGSPEAANKAMLLMGEFCRQSRAQGRQNA